MANVLARYKMSADELRKVIKFEAIFVLCSSYTVLSLSQIINDLCSSKDGTLLGPRRKGRGDKQFVKVFMTNPDLLWAASWPRPRLGPLAVTIACKEVFKAEYGYELEVEQFGKPTLSTMDYAERQLRKRAKKNGVHITHFYMIGDNPASDIAGGNAKGWSTILVKTGVFDPKADSSTSDGNDKKYPATYVAEDFEEALNWIYSKENLHD